MQPQHGKRLTARVVASSPAVQFEEQEPEQMIRGMDILIVGASGFTGQESGSLPLMMWHA